MSKRGKAFGYFAIPRPTYDVASVMYAYCNWPCGETICGR